MLLLSVLIARAATIPVTDSIATALAKANDGDTLILSGLNVFRERIVIDKNIRLLGTNSPVIDAGGRGTPVTINAPDVEVCAESSFVTQDRT